MNEPVGERAVFFYDIFYLLLLFAIQIKSIIFVISKEKKNEIQRTT